MPEFDFTSFVKSLPKEKLEELVLKYAPDSYREEVSNQNLDDNKVKKAFEKLSKQIIDLFENDEYLDGPSDFEGSLVRLSEKLSGLWDRNTDETGNLFLFCIKKIDLVQQEGLLYNSYHDEMFDGSAFLTIVQKYIVSLPFERKIEFVQKLEEELSSNSCGTFYNYPNELNLIYCDPEIPRVMELFLQNVKDENKPFRKEYYYFLKNGLDLIEKEYVLTKIYHLGEGLCLDLVETLEQLQKHDVAIQYLEALKQANPDPWAFTEELFVKLMQLKKIVELSIKADLIIGLKVYKTDTLLEKTIDFLPEENLEFESTIKSASHYYFLKYLIGKNRIDEAYQLVSDSKTLDDQSIYKFFTTYGKRYPEDSTHYFIQRLHRELPNTGDRHYESIVDSLKYIRKVNPIKTQEILEMLRKEYKRRRNLMAMLEGF